MIAQLAAAGVGIWLMAAPAVFGYGDATAADVDWALGPIAASIALVAVFEATRGFRRVNYVVAALLIVLPWLLDYPTAALLNSVASGIALAILSAIRGRRSKEVGGGWRALIDDSRD